MKIQENGPWTVSDWREGRIAIQSDDFHFDAALEVSGDFESLDVKRAYAEEVCLRLNTTNPVSMEIADAITFLKQHSEWLRVNRDIIPGGIQYRRQFDEAVNTLVAVRSSGSV